MVVKIVPEHMNQVDCVVPSRPVRMPRKQN